jgi:hypothetical protein
MRVILYGTAACHLCEIAEEMLQREGRSARLEGIDKIDISDDDALFDRYGVRIPVLQRPDGRELDWPFDGEALRAFLLA